MCDPVEGKTALRVCYFGTYRANYSRNQIMIEGLRRSGVDVTECNVPLWRGIEDRVQAASGGWLQLSFLARVVQTYWRLLLAYRQVGQYDVMVLGYPGQLDVVLARLLTWLRGKPLVLDVFMSLYLIALERGLTDKHPTSARVLRALEKLACLLPDRLLLDTAAYVRWFEQMYGLDPARFALVPTGADDRVFRPVPVQGAASDSAFTVLYYGTFIPNHGVEHIVEAACLLEGEGNIRFELVGEGPTRARAEELVQRYRLTNVHFAGWVDKEALPALAASADVCLGVFGTTPQSMMTVQNKIYEGLAMARPVITGESPTVSAQFEHGQVLYLTQRSDPQSLARAIRTLRKDPALRDKLADRGHKLFVERYTMARIGQIARKHLQALLKGAAIDPDGERTVR